MSEKKKWIRALVKKSLAEKNLASYPIFPANESTNENFSFATEYWKQPRCVESFHRRIDLLTKLFPFVFFLRKFNVVVRLTAIEKCDRYSRVTVANFSNVKTFLEFLLWGETHMESLFLGTIIHIKKKMFSPLQFIMQFLYINVFIHVKFIFISEFIKLLENVMQMLFVIHLFI